MKKSILFAVALFATGALYAQKDSLNAVIQVENEYNPVVTKAVKKGFTPTTEESDGNTPLELEFSQEATPFKGFTGERKIADLLPKQNGNYPGYARLGYGTGNNVDAKISYQYNIGENDKVSAVASLEGFNNSIDSPEGKWDSRIYSSWAGAEYSHKFGKVLSKSNIEFGNNVFNYNTALPGDKQNVQKFHIGTGVESLLTGPFAYDFGIHYSRNHYRHLPFLWNEAKQQRGHFGENNFGADATLKYELTDNIIRDITADVNFDYYSYYKHIGYKDYAELNITPATNLKTGRFDIRLGAQLNFITKGCALFAIAPDIRIEGAINKNISFYTSIKGGRKASTLEVMEGLSPYWASAKQLKPAYTVADATAGIRLSQDALSVNAYIGAAYTKDDLLPYANISEEQKGIASYIAQENTTHAYAGARVGYDYKGWLKGAAEAKYNYWKCDTRSHLGTKPEFELELNGEARVLEDIYVNLTYSFATYANDAPSLNKNELNLRASYKFADRFGAFIEGNNLLNRDYVKYAGYYEQGINFLMGLSASF